MQKLYSLLNYNVNAVLFYSLTENLVTLVASGTDFIYHKVVREGKC